MIVITQNVDDLHERAGSSNVIHVHGQLKLARSSIDEKMMYDLGEKSISMGDTCEKGIGPLDLLIAAHALSGNFVLITNNEKEFKRVKNLKIENWAK